MSGVARRTVVAAAGGAGLTAALAACGGGDGGGKNGSGGADGGAEVVEEATPLAMTADIPVGGGKVIADKGVVVTQPKKGEFKAYSSRCTHQGCHVGSVADGVIVCPCHQSRFDANDGSVKQGPATRPLEPTPIEVVGEAIRLG
ncbi:Rieske (2Fe-2S) protein [Streptomyces roseicoloratus]|uniref:Cytochrome bc1 complex Rieske iron-sulfur subunit n=1 Tax=Streptomyces roseicoloratus TaxID=2508722 RepID=A0ABY9S0Y6_9ACTN|nr:Rieske (2Fe-2S) protein [Streptomyces roseicoloratus]WMX48086.1 Rieske (2Fe-2S) protein [Streptomyces roseicoloratus]